MKVFVTLRTAPLTVVGYNGTLSRLLPAQRGEAMSGVSKTLRRHRTIDGPIRNPRGKPKLGSRYY